MAEDLEVLDRKLTRLRLDYERYFLGNRPREPVVDRSEVHKTILQFSNQAIQNTALRFKFNALNSRYVTYRRQWDSVIRQMEAGTYARDVFKANIRRKYAEEHAGGGADEQRQAASGGAGDEELSRNAGQALYQSYVAAAESCGQPVKGLTPEKLQAVIDRQTAALRERLGCRDVSFRVVVQDGRVKLKAGPVKSA